MQKHIPKMRKTKLNDHLVKSEAWLNAARIWFAMHENTRGKDSSE
jgi:hypothetical protein